MKLLKIIIVLYLCALSVNLSAQVVINVESGVSSIQRNDFSDGGTGSIISFVDDFDTGNKYNFRLGASWTDNSGLNIWFGKIVLIQYSTSGTFEEAKTFEGATFQPGAPVFSDYQFNGYRFGYSRVFLKQEKMNARAGITLNIRQGGVSVEDNQKKASFSDDGVPVLPLLNAGFEYLPFEKLTLAFEFEGIYFGPAGSLLDGAFTLNLAIIDKLSLFGGYRRFQGVGDQPGLFFNDLIINSVIGGVKIEF